MRDDAGAQRMMNRVLIQHEYSRQAVSLNAFPGTLVIDPSGMCNLDCVFCSNRGRRTRAGGGGMMSPDDYRRIIDALSPSLVEVVMGDKNEPLLHPGIFEMIAYTSRVHGIRCVVQTNLLALASGDAGALVEAGPDRVVISAAGASRETYAAYHRGGDFSQVMDGIRRITDYKKRTGNLKPELRWRYVVFKHNEREIPAAKDLAGELSIGIEFRPGHVYDIETNFREWLPQNPEFVRYDPRAFAEGTVARERLAYRDNRERCSMPWFMMAVDAEGFVYPCCAEHEEDYRMGNIHQEPLLSIWNGGRYRAIREFLATGRVPDGPRVQCLDCLEIRKPPEEPDR